MDKRLTQWLAVIILLSIIFAACSSNKETLQYESDREMKATLKLMALDSKKELKDRYVDLFNTKYPNIEIEFVIHPVYGTFLEKYKEEKPDIVLLTTDQYKQFIEEGILYDLDTMFSDDEFNLGGIHPEIINSLRSMGNGKLYGLPPNFQTKALYYNKDLFDTYGIPYPQDAMTWEEVIELAKRFPSEDGISGLYMQDFYTLVNEISWTKNMMMVNEKEMQVVLNTESYKKVFDLIFDAYKSNHIVLPSLDGFDINDPFILGTSAMTMDYYYYMYHKIGGAKMRKGSDYQLNWDVASAPVDELNRTSSPHFSFNGIFSINADSDKKQAAWEFVKFVNSEEYAKAKSRVVESMPLPSIRTEFIYNPDGKRMEAFYNLKPDLNIDYLDYDLYPNGFFSNLEGAINSEVKAAWVGVKTLDEAIISMQERVQLFLDQNRHK